MGLITDRTRENVLRRNTLASLGWANMTEAERAEWLGDPMATVGANLFAPGPYYSSVVELKYRTNYIMATALSEGVYMYAISIIGEASKYEGKTFTLSVDSIVGSGKPQIALYWHDDNGYEYAGASISETGSVTFTVFPNTNARRYLAAYVYVTSDVSVPAGSVVKFYDVMLELGSERHSYVPFTEVVATEATKGAYNYSDLNRVERTVAEISDELGLGLITKTDWKMWDFPRKSDLMRYVDNVRAIRNAVGSNIALPEAGDKFTFSDANNIETILLNARRSMDSALRCGDVFCGDL